LSDGPAIAEHDPQYLRSDAVELNFDLRGRPGRLNAFAQMLAGWLHEDSDGSPPGFQFEPGDHSDLIPAKDRDSAKIFSNTSMLLTGNGTKVHEEQCGR